MNEILVRGEGACYVFNPGLKQSGRLFQESVLLRKSGDENV